MLNQEFKEFCNRSDFENVKLLPKILESTIDSLSKIIIKKDFSITLHPFFKKTLNENPKLAEKLFWKDIDERINFISTLMCLKSESLLDGLTYSFNSKNFLLSIVIARSLFENAAVFYQYQWKIINTYKDWQQDPKKYLGPDFKNKDVISKEMEDFLILFSHGTRDETLLGINKDWKQKNILNYFDYWSKNKDFGSVRRTYEFLSDFCHPNALSNMIFQVLAMEDDKFLHTRFDKNQKDSVLLFMGELADSIEKSCLVMLNGINELQKINFSGILEEHSN
jgi:hypothetical protein